MMAEYGAGSKERCQDLMAYGREGATLHPTPKQKQQQQADLREPDRFTECEYMWIVDL